MYTQLLYIMLTMVNTNPKTETDLKSSINDFSLNFLKSYHQIGDKNDNLFYSSISLATTLSLLISGSDGETKQQLVNLLGYNDLIKNYTLEVAFKKLKEDFKLNDFSNDHLYFKMANRIYLKSNSKLIDDFRLISKQSYDTDLLESDFKKDSINLVNKINNWIELETNNKIRNVFKEIDQNTVMLIINIVYFKAKWLKPFPLSNVRLRKFTNLNGERKKINTMSDLDYYHYGQFNEYKIVELDYFNNCSMYIILPNDNLDNFILNFNSKQLNNDLKLLKTTHLDLQLPKFKLKSDLNLKNILENLGIKLLFNENANLNKISNETNLMVTEAIQNAFINVDEDGTEAAATTIYKLMPRSMFMGTEMHINRPFIFIIRLNGVNIFVGAIKKL